MANFFVGQRVRLVLPYQPQYMGLTGVVVALFAEKETHIPTYPINCDIDWDHVLDDNTFTQTHTSRLEPILPSGHRAGDYSLSDLLDRCRAGEGVVA